MQRNKHIKIAIVAMVLFTILGVAATSALAAEKEMVSNKGAWGILLGFLKDISSNADSAPERDSGFCGENLAWKLDGDGVLTISGQGTMEDYVSTGTCIGFYEYVQESGSQEIPIWETNAPWQKYYGEIKKIVMEDGVPHIGKRAFAGCCYVEDVTFPTTLENIGEFAFYFCMPIEKLNFPENLKMIEKEAFEGCINLGEIYFPSGLIYIGVGAFAQTGNIKIVNYGANMDKWNAVAIKSGNTDLYKAVIRYNVLYIQ